MRNLLILLIAPFLIVGFAGATPLTPKETKFVQQSKSALLESMKDPDSTKFRRFRFVKDSLNGVNVFCGEINAKNSYGAYVGYKKFYFADTNKQGVEGESNDSSTTAWLGAYCDNSKGIELPKSLQE